MHARAPIATHSHPNLQLTSLALPRRRPPPPPLQLAHKLQVLRDAAERGDPLPFTPTAADVAAAAVAAAEAASRAPLGAHLAAAGVEVSIAPAGTPRTEGKKKLRIPGL